MDLIQYLVAIPVVLALFLSYIQWKPRSQISGEKRKSPPEPEGAWPVIGHLLQMNPKIHVAETLAAMADKNGPVFSIRLGMLPVLVVNNWESVKECFTTNDKAFASRPPSSFAKYLCYDYAAFGIAPYGRYWRDVRKMVLRELLSTQRLEKLKQVRISEVQTSIKEIFLNISEVNKHGNEIKAPARVDLGDVFEKLTLNIVLRKIAGGRYTDSDVGKERDSEFRRVLKEFEAFARVLVVSDIIPFRFLKWLDPQGNIKSMKRLAKELDKYMQIWVDEHKEGRMKNSGDGDDELGFIDVLLSTIKDESICGFSKEVVIKSTILVLIVAGTSTTSRALSWVISLLLNHRQVLQKAQEEIDSFVGKERWVEESDIKNLVYLHAIVKETMRLHPPAPVPMPRQADEDCNVAGYFIPKGTQLYVNVWKIQRDPRIWPEPEKFFPERFLSGDHAGAQLDFSSQNFELNPFGNGRRICPGMSFALQVMHLTLARLLQAFDISRVSDLPVDTAGYEGKAPPLEALMMPRLPNLDLYG
ncbi:cytochrome P450 CYP82D47-like [Coffea arabica]|uniref:Cytochrome P450 CYP82D47-like n=1 Tax=Coffea arabica TaxID=13443 RepID=A0ABM4VWF1_COFAR